MEQKDGILQKIKTHFKSYDKKDVAIMIAMPTVLIPLFLIYKHVKKKVNNN